MYCIGHGDEGHKDDSHKDDGHKDDGRKDDGHKDDGHKDDGHKDDGHKDDGHGDDHNEKGVKRQICLIRINFSLGFNNLQSAKILMLPQKCELIFVTL